MTSPLTLAWKQLVHGRLRLLVATTAVAFAVVLMLLQLGFRTPSSAARCEPTSVSMRIVLISPQSSLSR
jgi:putative ABC transport system permease protein